HRIAARVTSRNGLSITSPEITVNVVANQRPAVSVSRPVASDSLVMGTATMLAATATDIDGTVDSIEFFVNGTTVGKTDESPFEVSWTPTQVGAFEITAKAIDNGRASTTSD